MSRNKGTPPKGLTRRDFLKSTGGTLAAAGLATGGLGLLPREVQAAEMPARWDETADVIVIGSGFAGLAAAIEAHNAGAKVIICEKMMTAGGNSIINGGVFAAAGSPKQKAQGVKDSPELLLKDMLKAGLNMNHVDITRIVAERSVDAVQWTVDYLDVQYKEKVNHLGGHSVPRSYQTYNSSGSAIVQQELAKVKELGLKVRTRTYLESLVTDKNGRIMGVKVRSGYRFPREGSGSVKYFKANKGLVMATGGFSQDIRMRTIQDPRLTSDVDSTNQPGATAEALLQMLGLGAMFVQPSWIQLGPWTSPDEKGMGVGYMFPLYAAFPYGVMVDPSTGERFINELANRKLRADATINTGHPCIVISDSVGVRDDEHALAKQMKKGVVKKFDSLDALAKGYNMPADKLKKQVVRYNSYVRSGTDEEFGKYIQKDHKPIEKPPYYAMRVWPKVHHTMGGVQINTRAQVVNLDGEPIKGLYAAGELAGGIHGAVRLGSCAVLDCIVMGRIAGKNAATKG